MIRSPPPTDHQQPLSRRLRFLSLLGNRLRCDCKVSNLHHHNDLNRQISIYYNLSFQSLWLRRVLESKRVSVFLPPCFSPFSRNTLTLQSFEGTFHHQHHNHQHRHHIIMKNMMITNIAITTVYPGTSLCSLTDETRIPKFFRVTDQVSKICLNSSRLSLSLSCSRCRTASTSQEPPSPPSP